ncbi:MAG: Rne/Rng family ribonuclease [Oscillatoria sp. SIO1A7]|nr:Rne/Rng family ribonuclease [Oscillatoria sp. SIO1A7]
MPKQIIIAEQHRVAAVFAEDRVQELVVAKGTHQVSDIYLGSVENVISGIDAAFVNIGDPERNGFIHVTDLGPLRLRRSSGAITELLAPQQKVLVQIMKEPTGNKGPRLTGNITLPGRYLVLMPFGRGVNLSRRIRSEAERSHLRALGILIKPSGMGLLMRTEAEGVEEEAILEDLESLQKQWEAIQREAATNRAPALLNRDDDFVQRVLREMYSNDVNRIVVDSPTAVPRVKKQIAFWNGGKSPQGVLIDEHQDDRLQILEYFRVNAAIREALKPRVDLPSGGYIIIEPTEALTVIDVNSGSFTRSATARETVLWTNCEAATEIARQLRLRNLAGVIIVDFIDMDSRRDQIQVIEHFNKALKADKARPQIAQLSELGLVELTRKRQGQNIYELFGRPCPTCAGLGHIAVMPGEQQAAIFDAMPLPRSSAPVAAPEVPAPVVPQVEESRIPDGSSAELPDLEPANDLQELDLLNHPSYQEIGAASTRRRRRRRLDSPEEGSPVSDRPIIRSAVANNNVSAEFGSDTESTGARIEKPERVRTRVREIEKPPAEPPEVISIKMTSDEQDIYALMGISPLVLFDGEVKNPKNAMISVKEPGKSGRSTSPEKPVPAVAAPHSPEGDAAPPEEDGEPSAPPTTRRRRRRSSAIE